MANAGLEIGRPIVKQHEQTNDVRNSIFVEYIYQDQSLYIVGKKTSKLARSLKRFTLCFVYPLKLSLHSWLEI